MLRRLLLTNDDGIDAPGLAALQRAARGLGETRVIAPAEPHSGCGHAVTTHREFRAENRDGGKMAVWGTPADCVRLGLHHLATETEWVLSGINAGGNLGADVFHSGTVAAVREAVFHGRRGIALSHYIARGRPLDWEIAERRAARVLRVLLDLPSEPGTFWSVNLPHPAGDAREPEIVFCPLETAPLPLSFAVDGEMSRYNGDYQTRGRQPGRDVAVCFGGDIAVVRLGLTA